MSDIGIDEASVLLGLPAFLIRDMVSYKFNERKLEAKTTDPHVFDHQVLQSYADHLSSKWPGTGRIDVPDWIERFLTWEAGGKCALCRVAKPNYENAHIVDWARTRSHHPKNLVRLCLDCHTSHGKGGKLLQGLKEELLRERALLSVDILYDCRESLKEGDAAYVRNGVASHASAGTATELAVGFVQSKVGDRRCSITRVGLVVGFADLKVGHWYFLSPVQPGKIMELDLVLNEYDQLRRQSSSQFWWQRVGRAESPSHLSIQLSHDVGMPSASDKLGA